MWRFTVFITYSPPELLYRHATGQNLTNTLLTVCQNDFNTVLLVQVFGQMLGTIDRAVLSTRAAKGEHQIGKATLQVALYMSICQPIDTVEEGRDLAIVLQEFDDGSIQTRQLFIRFIASGVVRATAVKDITSAIAALILGDTTLEGEGEDTDNKGRLTTYGLTHYGLTPLPLSCREGSNYIWGRGGNAILTFSEGFQDLAQFGIGAAAFILQQVAQVIKSGRNAVEEMLLTLEIAAEAVGTEDLQEAEENK